MVNAIFTSKVNPDYDDLPELHYHFPKTYLNQVKNSEGDWVIYYEPRRSDSLDSSRGGRQAYFGMARVVQVVPDPKRKEHYYALVGDYIEFSNPVPFRINEFYFEKILRKNDGSVSKGAFGRAVRNISKEEFMSIVQHGFSENMDEKKIMTTSAMSDETVGVAEPEAIYPASRSMQIFMRPQRDAVFARIIQREYKATCAFTGLKLVNGGGRCEVEAAHIRPVADKGPDSVRNGIALSRTVHWMFDRGIISLADNGEILVANRLIPDSASRLLNPDRQIILPANKIYHPHPTFLRYHRENIYKGD